MPKLSDTAVYWRDHYALLNQPQRWIGDTLPRAVGFELVKYLEQERPKVIVEGGSGLSTALLAGYAVRSGAHVLSLEDDPYFFGRTSEMLHTFGLDKFVELRLVNASNRGWYHTSFPYNIDFALIDGPGGDAGTAAAMEILRPFLNPGRWQVWMTKAQDARQQLEDWRRQHQIHFQTYPLPGDLAVITPFYRHLRMVNGNAIAVTILSRGDPQLTWDTFGSLNFWALGLLDMAHVTVLRHQSDPELTKELEQASFVNVLDVVNKQQTSGQLYSRLFRQIPVNIPFHLHLNAGWRIGTTFPWLEEAKNTLDQDEGIGQVRLRHRGEHARMYNVVNGKEIRWQRDEYGTLLGDADYTTAPSLMRSEDVMKLWPADAEMVAARRFRGLIAQSDPGVFHRMEN